MTVTVEAGLTLAALQARLEQHRQWVPLDPPGAATLSLEHLLAFDLNGPRRHGHGTAREHVIGLKVALADGRIIASGGRVVKNVAGFDLMKLFIGAKGSLGIIVEATFKLLPLPEVERFVQQSCSCLADAAQRIEAVVASPLTPVVFDLHRLESGAGATLVLGFAGAREAVEWQLIEAARLGVSEPATLAYDEAFRAQPARRISVLPSELLRTLEALGPVRFVARAGNGIIYLHGEADGPKSEAAPALKRLGSRTKETFDPHHLLPEIPA
jgi:glycolate oxidase FAD binding subunit